MKLFVDYAGDKPVVVDPESGMEQPVETFEAILGASELTYVEASATQQSDDWIRTNELALTLLRRLTPCHQPGQPAQRGQSQRPLRARHQLHVCMRSPSTLA